MSVVNNFKSNRWTDDQKAALREILNRHEGKQISWNKVEQEMPELYAKATEGRDRKAAMVMASYMRTKGKPKRIKRQQVAKEGRTLSLARVIHRVQPVQPNGYLPTDKFSIKICPNCFSNILGLEAMMGRPLTECPTCGANIQNCKAAINTPVKHYA